MQVRAVALAVALSLGAPPAFAQPNADDAAVRRLLDRFERAIESGDRDAYNGLLVSTVVTTPAAAGRASNFTQIEFRRGVTRATIIERDRQDLLGTLPGSGYRLMVDAFIQSGDRARVATWQIDVRKVDEAEWLISDEERVSAVESLYRLSLNPGKQYDARDFHLKSEDLDLTLVEGTVFSVDTDQGTTGLVFMGHGEMRFSPTPDTEKGQVRIFSGSDALESRFDAAYVRFGAFSPHGDPAKLVQRSSVDQRDFKKADQIFREESVKAFTLDLGDLARETWSLLPGDSDFLSEVRTRKFGTITYARSAAEAEDISVFNRRQQRNISVYASVEKIASRGRFYSDEELALYDILGYDIDLTVAPDRNFLTGRAKIRLKTRAPIVNQITLRLADSLNVQSVVSDEFGRLFNLRAKNQNAVLVNLPASVLRDTEMTLTVNYSGRLAPQPPERETLAMQGPDNPASRLREEAETFIRPEPSQLYSSRSYWYPQATITDYATATLRITVPATMSCVATGEPLPNSPALELGSGNAPSRKVYQFAAVRPVRYLAFLLSRFTRATQVTVAFDAPPPSSSVASQSRGPQSARNGSAGRSVVETAAAGPSISGGVYNTLEIDIEANQRQLGRARSLLEPTVDIARFYQAIVGDSPYQTFTLALIENALPGGHSPGYFVALNQPLPNTPLVWRSDPANFEGFPEFFLAHELAHQWWGQAVGWQNYHEQWLSEGFAQFFAGLYAEHRRGPEVFGDMLRQWRKWSLEKSDQGPVYLGYRLGHIRNDGRVFRALVYNKGAAVLQMLRRLLGDEAFFRGIRRFYVESRYQKSGTEDLRHAMEAESNRSLERFFERWIYGATLPKITFTYRVEGQEAVLRFEQVGDVFDIPVTVTLQYADRRSSDVPVAITDRLVEKRVPLEGTLRSAEVSKDDGAVLEITSPRSPQSRQSAQRATFE